MLLDHNLTISFWTKISAPPAHLGRSIDRLVRLIASGDPKMQTCNYRHIFLLQRLDIVFVYNWDQSNLREVDSVDLEKIFNPTL